MHVRHVCEWTGKTSFPFLSLPAASFRSHDGLSIVLNALLCLHGHCQPMHELARLHQLRAMNERTNEQTNERMNKATNVHTLNLNKKTASNRNHQMNSTWQRNVWEHLFSVCVILSDNFRRFLHASVCARLCTFNGLYLLIFSFSFIRSASVVFFVCLRRSTIYIYMYILLFFGWKSSTSFVCD